MPYSRFIDSCLVWAVAQKMGESSMVGRNLKVMIVSIAAVVSMILCVPMMLGSESAEKSMIDASFSELSLGFMEQMATMNPYLGLKNDSMLLYGLVYDSLMTVGNDLETVPDLALSWWPVPDDIGDPDMIGMPYGSVWQYNLTHNATWSDGVPFTADDVVYNVWLNADVTHYNSLWSYQPYSFFMNAAWKVDDYTVRISFWNRATGLPMPSAYGNNLTFPILPKHMLENYAFAYIGFGWNGTYTDLESPGMPIVGTGPFIASPTLIADWNAGDHITLLKNPNCHWSN